MKVILQRDIPKVGKGGDIVAVADGYARNYLFPRQYAVPATGGALKEHAARAAHEKARAEKARAEADAGAARLESGSLSLTGKVGSGTKLYGSITAQDVSDAIQRQLGVSIDKRRIGLADPIKSLGVYTVPVRLHSDLVVPVQLEVTTEAELERRRSLPPEPAPEEAVVEAGAAEGAESGASEAQEAAPTA